MGVVLYEMLSLVQPFAASNVAALIMKIVNAEPPPLPAECREEVCDATWPYLAVRDEVELLSAPIKTPFLLFLVRSV